MPDVHVQLVGRLRRKLNVPDKCKVSQLRSLVASEFRLSQERLRLVTGGKILEDLDPAPAFNDGDTVLASVIAPAQSADFDRGVTRGAGEYLDPEAEEERFRLRSDATRVERELAHLLQRRLHVPDVVLQLLFSIRRRTILFFLLWLCLCPVAARFHLGPLYVLGTILALIFTNLGTREPGELSAYSVFNEGMRALPGQLNADAIDEQMRRGQM
mmetsp:Transcript_16167/g.48447  ORF Transcript_16167/g.48447 Transcript_16167/m.48447 type:complete len:214 (-) Transcript_16167:760-1401(-)